MTTGKEKETVPHTVPTAAEETRVIRKLSLVSIIGNTVLSGFKLMAGVLGHPGKKEADVSKKTKEASLHA